MDLRAVLLLLTCTLPVHYSIYTSCFIAKMAGHYHHDNEEDLPLIHHHQDYRLAHAGQAVPANSEILRNRHHHQVGTNNKRNKYRLMKSLHVFFFTGPWIFLYLGKKMLYVDKAGIFMQCNLPVNVCTSKM